MPLAYEVMDGNTFDRTALRGFLHKIEATYWQPFVFVMWAALESRV
jgi:hypothetical protein